MILKRYRIYLDVKIQRGAAGFFNFLRMCLMSKFLGGVATPRPGENWGGPVPPQNVSRNVSG